MDESYTMSEPLRIVNQIQSLDAVDAGQHSERRIDQLTKEWPVSFGAFPTPIRRFEFRDGNIGLPFPGKQAAYGPEGDVARKEPYLGMRMGFRGLILARRRCPFGAHAIPHCRL